MADAKNSGAAQSPSNGFQCKAPEPRNQHTKESSRSSSPQLPFGRPHPLMAPQLPSLNAGQSHPSNGAWATAVWEHAPNISEAMEGSNGAPSEYNVERTLDWEVKSSPWDWENMSAMFSSRGGGEAHSSKGPSYTVCHSSVSRSVAFNAGEWGSRSSFTKAESEHRSDTTQESTRLGDLVVERRASPQRSVVTMDQQRKLVLGLGGPGSSAEGRRPYGREDCNRESPKVGVADSLMGLKLGRRMYYEDFGGVRGDGAAAVFAVCPPGKKQRVQSPGVQVPRCQVEGCKQDLSSAKDYHRRHKVCDMHSKATKVMAAGIEQRFCQQCSRFHVLTEFDEGKRSCRRRLAGHNERRRKPQPESAAIASTGSSAALHGECGSHGTIGNGEEDKQGPDGLAERGCYIPTQRRTPGSSSTSVEDSDDQSGSLGTNLQLNQAKSPWQGMGRVEDSTSLACQVACGERQAFLSSPTADGLLMLLQSPKGQIPGAGVHQCMMEGSGSLGPGLTLASSTGPASVLSGLEGSNSPSVSRISDSGRALSLLSTQAWGSRGGTPGSVSLDLSTRSDVTLEQLISENSGAPFSPRRQRSQFHSTASTNAEKPFPLLPPSSTADLGISTNVRVENRDQHGDFMPGLGLMGSFESHSMLALMQGQPDFHGVQGSGSTSHRPTIDLMQLPSPQSHNSSNHASSGQFPQFSTLRPFEASLFESQHML